MSNFASKDLTAGQLNALVKKVGGHESVLGILSENIKFHLLSGVASSAQILTLSGESIADLVMAGKYDWVNKDINNKNFPHNFSPDGEWEWDSWNPKDSISSEKAHAACSEDDWMPAMAQHLLAFGAKYPEAQRANPIVGLDSSYRDGFDVRHVPVLRSGDGGRELYLDNWIGGWSSNARFLRVRRLSA